jgi:voltage-gated potassium channel
MSDKDSRNAELGHTGYEIFIGALSVLSLVNIVLLALLRDPATQNVVRFMDLLLSVVFLGDFLVRLRRAPSRSTYFLRQYGWADLLASLPFPQIKILRVFRLARVVRLLRKYGARNIGRSLLGDRAGSALLSLLLVGVLMMEFGSLGLLRLESASPDANIVNASDAMWYVIVTMSTVGYGDQYPVTNPGRELGSVIIVVGVGIFGTLTGYLANLFLAPNRGKATKDETAQDETTPDETTQVETTQVETTQVETTEGESARPDAALPVAARSPVDLEDQLILMRAALRQQQAALDELERSLRAG